MEIDKDILEHRILTKILLSFWTKIKTSGSAPYNTGNSFSCWEEAGFSQNDTRTRKAVAETLPRAMHGEISKILRQKVTP